MKKFLVYTFIVIILAFSGYYAFVYFFSYSQGYRAGELVKFSKKGVLYKTWEGQISQEATQPLWNFSVQDNEPKVIEQLKNLQGQNVKLSYKERFKTFPWWGDTHYFVTAVEQTGKIYQNNLNDSSNNTSENNPTIKALKQENEALKQRIKDLETTIDVLKNTSNK